MSPRRSLSLPPYDAPPAAMRTAGAWLARRDRGFTAEERREFDAWWRAAADHRAAFAQLERTFATFDALRPLRPGEGAGPDPDALAPPRTARRRIFPVWAAAGLAVAAALAVIFWPARPVAPPPPWRLELQTADYERTALPDGSVVELKAGAAMVVEFTADERRVRLSRGEALFSVAKNPVRPFTVAAGAVQVRAVGTAFNVRLHSAAVEVLVTEGKVQVAPPPSTRPDPTSPTATPSGTPLLVAGQKLTLAAGAGPTPAIVTLTTDEIARELAWRPEVAEFAQTPLADVIAVFNRCSLASGGLRIVIGDPQLASLRIGGNFRLDQPDAFVRLLERSFGITAERADGVIVLSQTP